MDGEYLIDSNRTALKSIFHKCIGESDSQFMTYNQYFKFCCKIKLYPELISSSGIQRIILSVLRKTISDDKPIEIYYLHFEKIFKTIAEHCFPSRNPIKLLISSIKTQCQALYAVALTTVPTINSNYEVFSPRHIMPNPVLTTRAKNYSVRHRVMLSNSISQRSFATKIDLHMTTKTQTLLTNKIIENQSPRIKIISTRSKMLEEKTFSKANSIVVKFYKTHKALVRNERTKKLLIKFLEKYIEMKNRMVLCK